MRKRTAAHTQLTLDDARKPTGRGGWRPNAGRPRSRDGVAHDVRADVKDRHPQHVTVHVVDGLPSLRDRRLLDDVHLSIAEAQRPHFSIVHFSVMTNHIHLLLETDDKAALSRGIGTFESQLARRINKHFGTTGNVFDDRYHTRSLTTPHEVRNALRYVLNNERHHAYERGTAHPPNWFDPYSSAAWFDGWDRALPRDEPWKRWILERPAPTAEPRTWLLAKGWKLHGLLALDDTPGVPRRRRSQK